MKIKRKMPSFQVNPIPKHFLFQLDEPNAIREAQLQVGVAEPSRPCLPSHRADVDTASSATVSLTLSS